MDSLPPPCLAGAGIRLWNAVFGRADVPNHLRETLLAACKQADRIAECREILRNETLCVQDEKGNVKPHPAVEIERKASIAMSGLLKDVIGKTSEAKDVASEVEDYFG